MIVIFDCYLTFVLLDWPELADWFLNNGRRAIVRNFLSVSDIRILDFTSSMVKFRSVYQGGWG